jgi:dienelactone hydrolase
LLIQAGASDDWTPASYCIQIANRAKEAERPFDIDVHWDAHHGSTESISQYGCGTVSVPNAQASTVGTHETAWQQSVDAHERPEHRPR